MGDTIHPVRTCDGRVLLLFTHSNCSHLFAAPSPPHITPTTNPSPPRLHHLQGCPRRLCSHPKLTSSLSPLSPSSQREEGPTFLPHGSASFTSTFRTLVRPPASGFFLFPISPPFCGSLEGEAAAATPKDGASGSVLTWIVNAASALLCWLLKGGRRVGWAQ